MPFFELFFVNTVRSHSYDGLTLGRHLNGDHVHPSARMSLDFNASWPPSMDILNWK